MTGAHRAYGMPASIQRDRH